MGVYFADTGIATIAIADAAAITLTGHTGGTLLRGALRGHAGSTGVHHPTGTQTLA